MKDRIIAHLDLDAFFVAVERLLDPSLMGKPVVVGGNPDGRGVVAAASYEVRRYGVHSAMPAAEAKRLCSGIIFVHSRHSLYGDYSRRVFRIVEEYTPLIERTSIDEGYLDITGCGRLFGHPMALAEKVKLRIKNELGLSVSIGIARNKLMAKIGSDYVKPDGIIYILPGHEKSFLANLPVEKIPGVGPAVRERLRRYSIRTVDDLARLGEEEMERIFGKHGVVLHKASLGVGSVEFGSTGEAAKSISREHTFSRDTNDLGFLEATLCRLTEGAASSLRAKGLKAKTVTLKLRYSDFKTISRSRSFSLPTDVDSVIFSLLCGLLKSCYKRRTSLRLVGVSLTRLEEGLQELLIKDDFDEKMKRLYHSLDQIRERCGSRAILHARSQLGELGE
jgi:DNA polymerase-4